MKTTAADFSDLLFYTAFMLYAGTVRAATGALALWLVAMGVSA